MAWLTACLATVLVMAGLDFVWLSATSGPFYRRLLGPLMAENPNMVAAVIFYLVYVAGILVFAVRPALASGDWRGAALMGALFGFCAYATYDLTNLATLKDWPLTVTLVDMAWGSVLTATAAGAGAFAALKLAS